MQTQKDLKEPLVENPQVVKSQIKPAPFFSLFKYSDSLDKTLMVVGSLAAMAGGASMPFFMIFFSQITSIFIDGNQDHAQEQGLEVAIKFFILGGATWFLNFLGIYTWSMTGKRQTVRFKKMYYQTLLAQQVAWYDSNDVNKLATQISGNMIAVQTAIGEKIAFLLMTTITSVFGFFYAYFKCWQLSLILTGFLPLLMISGVLLMKSMQLKAQLGKISYEGASGIAEQALSAIRTVKSFVAEQFEQTKFVQALSESQKKVVKYIFFSAGSLAGMLFIFLGLYSFGIWYGKQLIIWFDYSSADVLGTFFCFLIGGSSVGQIAPFMKNIAEGKVAMGRLFYLLNRNKTLIEPEPGVQIKEVDSISFQNVVFKYEKVNEEQFISVKDEKTKPKDEVVNITEENIQENQENMKANSKGNQLVLQGVSLNIQKGKVTAFVGESGSGKSTIIQLLMRYYDPTSGGILVNNLNMEDIDIKGLRRKIGFVGQEPVLFSMSIADNLKLSNPDLTNQEIENILKKANAWEFVSKFENGIDTYVGSGGTQLSGGQKQRVAIARALAKNPTILVLDQATSALDRKNEKEIQKTLQNLSEGKITTIVVAHRLSTIKNADKIIVMGKGKILQEGHHTELYEKEGPYHELVKSQMAADNQVHAQQTKQLIEINESDTPSNQITEEVIKSEAKKQQKPEEKYTKQQLDAVFGKLFKECKGSYSLLFFGCLAAILNGLIWPIFNIAFSNIMALMFEAKKNSEEINYYCWMFLIVAAIGAFTTFLYHLFFGLAGQRLVYTLRVKLFSKLLKLPVAFFDKQDNTAGGISAKISQDSYQIHNMITGVMGVIFLNVSTVSTSLILAFYYSWKLTLIVLALAPLLIVSGAINMSILKGMSQKSEKFEKAVGSMISDSVCNIRTVKSFGNQSIFLKLFSEKLEEISRLSSQKAIKSSVLQGLSRGSVMFVEGLTFWIAAILFADGQIADGKSIYIAIFSIIFAATGVGQNSTFMPDMGKAKLSGASIFEIIENKDEVEQAKQSEDPSTSTNKIEGNIQFKNVTFKYPERQAVVFNNFSLKINKGQKIAFVGPSGSGKSTIIQILMRFYPIQSGEVLVDGVDFRKYNLYSYRKHFGLVSQQPTLFVGSIKDNVIFNTKLKKNNEKKLEKYCKVAHALDFINQWPEKFQKEVGQKGSQISGGQKQRIALARCLIRQPEIMLLDESTSALDADTQKIVFENLKPVLKEKTSISIAHRLVTIEDANRIVVMRDGKIIEEGGYEQLMGKKENFYRLAKGTN